MSFTAYKQNLERKTKKEKIKTALFLTWDQWWLGKHDTGGDVGSEGEWNARRAELNDGVVAGLYVLIAFPVTEFNNTLSLSLSLSKVFDSIIVAVSSLSRCTSLSLSLQGFLFS